MSAGGLAGPSEHAVAAVRFFPHGIELRMAVTGTPKHALALAAIAKGVLQAPKIRKQVIALIKPDGEFFALAHEGRPPRVIWRQRHVHGRRDL